MFSVDKVVPFLSFVYQKGLAYRWIGGKRRGCLFVCYMGTYCNHCLYDGIHYRSYSCLYVFEIDFRFTLQALSGKKICCIAAALFYPSRWTYPPSPMIS